jgi:oligoribonuclease NrnB/cAMP/cGMP phosphodiesterase (DHH superfamily)
MSVTVPRPSVLVVYHANCPDGACAAWVAWLRFGNDAEYRPWHYGTPAPTDEEVEGREVYVLDFSFPRADLLRIHERAQSLRVFDHHKTAAKDLSDLTFATFDMGHSGAHLTWRYFSRWWSSDPPEGAWIISYVEDRDLWRFALPHSKEISAAVSSFGVTEDFRKFEDVSNYTLADLILIGEAILRYQEQTVVVALGRKMMGTLGGYTVQIANATTLFSEVAGELAKGHLFGAVWCVRADGKIQVSLRVRDGDFDVSVLAELYGGGGHAKAAGFESDLPWRELFGIVG